MKTYNLKIIRDRKEINAQLETKASPNPNLRLTADEFDSGLIEGKKLYECFQILHKKLDDLGVKLLCNGFRRDVRPSRMSLDMGDGIIAYKHRLGVRPTAKDKVNIFDPTDDIDWLGTVKEQEDFYREWLQSIGIVI
jgi:hypothetical protein